VTVASFSFTPADLTIKVGDSVLWTWAGGIHNVTGGPLGSGDRDIGAFYLVGGLSVGTYAYMCTIHPSLMQGTITVQP
jgi:plastocyanin